MDGHIHHLSKSINPELLREAMNQSLLMGIETALDTLVLIGCMNLYIKIGANACSSGQVLLMP